MERTEYFPQQQAIKDYNALPNPLQETKRNLESEDDENIIDARTIVGMTNPFIAKGLNNETLQSVMATVLWSPIESYFRCGFCSECGIC